MTGDEDELEHAAKDDMWSVSSLVCHCRVAARAQLSSGGWRGAQREAQEDVNYDVTVRRVDAQRSSRRT